MKIQIDTIKINPRIRKDVGDLSSLKESIQNYGLLHPIVINTKNQLIAGMRRLECARSLGWDYVDVKIVDVKDKKENLLLELSENELRKEFTEEEMWEGKEKLELLSKNFLYRFLYFWKEWIKMLFRFFFKK